jgi:hypothetical protein
MLNLTSIHYAHGADENITAVEKDVTAEISKLTSFESGIPTFEEKLAVVNRIATIGVENSHLLCESALINPPPYIASLLEDALIRVGFDVYYPFEDNNRNGQRQFVKVD